MISDAAYRHSLSAGEPVSEYIKILENQFGDHHIFQYLTRAERVKKLEHLIKNSGLLMSGNSLADLLETLLSGVKDRDFQENT